LKFSYIIKNIIQQTLIQAVNFAVDFQTQLTFWIQNRFFSNLYKI